MNPETEAIYEILRDCQHNGTPVSITRRGVAVSGTNARILDLDDQGVYLCDGQTTTTFIRLSAIDAVAYRGTVR